ncbi:MAG: WD40/YVTN/BNR-like repeat-containing protein [Nitrospiria bacterium]
MINEILIDPINQNKLYAGARPQGMLKSVDGGKTWFPARIGLKNTSIYPLAMDPSDSRNLYLGTFGGGIYKSEDGGEKWTEVNDGIDNTNIHALAIDPANPMRIIAGTSTGEIFQSDNGGAHWMPFSLGLPNLNGEVIVTLRFDENRHSRLYLAEGPLYVSDEKGPWKLVGEKLVGETLTDFEIDPAGRLFYAGTLKHGLLSSRDEGKSWVSAASLFDKTWIQKIVLSPANPEHLYVSVLGKGLFKSIDRAKNWIKLTGGLPQNDDVMSLKIDPKEPNRLYAGTHNLGIYMSSDGGTTWSAPIVKQEPIAKIIESLFTTDSIIDMKVTVPSSFNKCSKCHGWTDPILSQKKTYWRVSPNHRDWRETVKRMSPGAGLTQEEEKEIILFLDHFGRTHPPRTTD